MPGLQQDSGHVLHLLLTCTCLHGAGSSKAWHSHTIPMLQREPLLLRRQHEVQALAGTGVCELAYRLRDKRLTAYFYINFLIFKIVFLLFIPCT